LKFGILIIIHR